VNENKRKATDRPSERQRMTIFQRLTSLELVAVGQKKSSKRKSAQLGNGKGERPKKYTKKKTAVRDLKQLRGGKKEVGGKTPFWGWQNSNRQARGSRKTRTESLWEGLGGLPIPWW